MKTLILVTLIASFSSSTSFGDESFSWKNDEKNGTCDLYVGDQPVVRYVYAVDETSPESHFDTAKVFHQVYGPGTKTLITKGPGGKYPHHRGMYVGWNKTGFQGKTNDFWHCRNGEVQRHVKFKELNADENSGTMTALIHWISRDGNLVIEEERTLVARKLPLDQKPGYGWQIDWSTQLTSKAGTVTLNGDRQHAGFQFRAAQDVAEKNSATYIRPEGHPQEPAAYQVSDKTMPDAHVDLGWLAMTYPLDGSQYTIAYFEDSGMPSPSRYSERPYGRFGAFFSTQIEEDTPLRMRYQVLVTKGDPPAKKTIAKRYEQFLNK